MRIIVPQDVSDRVLISSNVLENEYPNWQFSSTYARGDFVISRDTHTVYRSLVDSNSGTNPDLEQVALADPLIDDPSPVRWQVISATNRWAIFDKKPSVQAVYPEQIRVVLEPKRIVGGIAGFGVEANSVRINVQSPSIARRNLLNETDTLSSQSVDVGAELYFLSFTGTGSVTLSGASAAGPLVGLGVGDRVSLAFTPSEGSLTLTVSGSVTNAQLERGELTPYQSVGDRFRRNVLDNTQDLTASEWVKSNVTIVPNVALAPDGTMTADRIVPNGLVTTKFISRVVSGIPADTDVTITFFGKAEFYRNLSFQAHVSQGWASDYDAICECQGEGTIINIATISQQPQPVIVAQDDGWYRVTWTIRSSSATTDRTFQIYAANNDGGYTHFGNGVDGILLGGVQVELGQGSVYQRVDDVVPQFWDKTIFDRTVPMQDETGVSDWYSFYFAPIEPLTEFVITDLPPYGDAQIAVEIDAPGQSARCGQLVIGSLRDAGITRPENTGFTGIDFSFVEQDDFGNLTTVRRAATRLSQFEVLLSNSTLLGFDRLMRDLRGGVAAVWIGDGDTRKAAINYGFYRDYRAVYQTNNYSIMSLQIQGIV